MKTITASRRVINCCLIAGMMLAFFVPQSLAAEWSEWTKVSGWKELDYRLKLGAYNSSSFKYSWFVQFRNHYPSKIHFGFHVGTLADNYPALVDRLNVDSGKVGEYWGLYPTDNVQQMKIWVGKVRLSENDDGPYASQDSDR